MNITFLLPTYPKKPLGGFRVVYEYANHLVNRGHSVNVVHPRILRQKPRKGGINNILRRRARLVSDYFIKPTIDWQRIDKKVRMLYVPELVNAHIPDGDVIIATSWQTAEYAMAYSKSKGRQFYLLQAFEIWDGPEDRVRATWLSPMEKIAVSRYLYEKGIEFGVSSENIVHIPNGIDLQKYRVTNDIASRNRRVVMMYSTLPIKGADDGIKAIVTSKQRYPGLQAVLFGTVKRPEHLPSWIEYFRKPDQEFLVRSIYNSGSIYVCSSWSEGWGLPPAEAMACGCAVLSTDNGGVRDYAVHGETALLSPIKKPQALSENLLRLLDDNNLRIKIAVSGHRNIQKFSSERAFNDFLEYISSTALR
jgi:glycosyltransferase involved in cell wall biosynthesis